MIPAERIALTPIMWPKLHKPLKPVIRLIERYRRLFRKTVATSKPSPLSTSSCDLPDTLVLIRPYTKPEVVLPPLYDYIVLSQQLGCHTRIVTGQQQIPAGCIAEFRMEYAGKLRCRVYLSMISVRRNTKTIVYWLPLPQGVSDFLLPVSSQTP